MIVRGLSLIVAASALALAAAPDILAGLRLVLLSHITRSPARQTWR
jgi:hypothetical protein